MQNCPECLLESSDAVTCFLVKVKKKHQSQSDRSFLNSVKVVFDPSSHGLSVQINNPAEPVQQILLDEAEPLSPIGEIRSRYLWCPAGQICRLESSCWGLGWLNTSGGI